MSTNPNVNGILAGLLKGARILAQGISAKTNNRQYPSGLSNSITVTTPESSGDGKATVRIQIRHPASAAYEFGSGIHATRGVAKKYVIAPRNVNYLKFPFTLNWMPGMKFAGMKGKSYRTIRNEIAEVGYSSGETFWNYVEHPGVEARPYIQPTIQEKKKEIARAVGRDFVASIFTGQKEQIVIKVSI
jgi:hypothetical protein